MTSTIELPPVETDPHYWIGWLSSATAHALRHLEATGPDGQPVFDRDFITEGLRSAWNGYADGYQHGSSDHLDDMQWAGFVVESADGEAQAYRPTYTEAEAAVTDVEAYWYEAEMCGHPLARSHVQKLRPFRVRQITNDEHAELVECPATIDREP